LTCAPQGRVGDELRREVPEVRGGAGDTVSARTDVIRARTNLLGKGSRTELTRWFHGAVGPASRRPAFGATGGRPSSDRIRNAVAVAADRTGSPSSSSTGWIAGRDGICTQADSTS